MSDDAKTPPQDAPNPFDAWLAAAPATPVARCPWCSARLDPPDVAVCPACGAQLRSGEIAEIPGVTVVDPAAVRRVAAVKPSSGAGLLTWLTGDRALMEAALATQQAPPPVPSSTAAPASGWPAGGADGSGTTVPPAIGPASSDAVAPPDLKLRWEMARIGLEDAAAPAPAESAEPADAVEVAGDDAVDPGTSADPDTPGEPPSAP